MSFEPIKLCHTKTRFTKPVVTEPESNISEPVSNIHTTMEELLKKAAPLNDNKCENWTRELIRHNIKTPADLFNKSEDEIKELANVHIHRKEAVSARLQVVLLKCKRIMEDDDTARW